MHPPASTVCITEYRWQTDLPIRLQEEPAWGRRKASSLEQQNGILLVHIPLNVFANLSIFTHRSSLLGEL